MTDLDKDNSGKSQDPQRFTTEFQEDTDRTVFRSYQPNETSIDLSGDNVPHTQSVSSRAAISTGPMSGAKLEGSQADSLQVLKSRFVLEEKLGSGGMGTVFRAKDLRKVEARDDQPYIAVKVLNNDFRAHPDSFIALEREASKSQKLRHENVVSIFDFDKDGDVPFITMELLEGQELADLLKLYPNGLPEDMAWTVIEGMLKGLIHAHAQGVIHADFKPGNVFVTKQFSTKILDFGIARAMQLNPAGEHIPLDTGYNPSRVAALTPAYASREMLNGDNPEPRDDLYALGVVIYMVLTGRHPFGRVSAKDAASEKLQPERIKHLSRRRWRTIERCLSFSRQGRPDSATDVFEGLFQGIFHRSNWKAWGAAAAVGAISLSILLSSSVGEVEISEVKEVVRAETLVEAQLIRIDQLLADARLDLEWNRSVLGELQTLRTIAPQDVTIAATEEEIIAAYVAAINASNELDEGFALYQRAQQFNGAERVLEALQAVVLSKLESLQHRDLDASWLTEAEQSLSYAQKYFEHSSLVASAKNDVLDHLFDQVIGVAALNQPEAIALADQAWNTFGHDIFDEERHAAINKTIADGIAQEQQKQQKKKAQIAAQKKRQALVNQAQTMLQSSCLQLDVDELAAVVKPLMTATTLKSTGDVERANKSELRGLSKRIGGRISECVQKLGALDPDRALSLQKRSQQHFSQNIFQVNAPGHGVDPCSLHYLVGNGKQRGPSGYCADRLGPIAQADNPGANDKPAAQKEAGISVDAQTLGPRLVVVPGGGPKGKFAISKYEISWSDLGLFCQQSEVCAVPENGDLPVTDIAIEVVEAYASWLTTKTGYEYRLPTRQEWQQVQAAVAHLGGESKVSRARANCQNGLLSRNSAPKAVQSGSDNPLGLVNWVGNVQELIRASKGYIAVGASFADNEKECTATTQREVAAEGDPYTGFRLVREVS